MVARCLAEDTTHRARGQLAERRLAPTERARCRDHRDELLQVIRAVLLAKRTLPFSTNLRNSGEYIGFFMSNRLLAPPLDCQLAEERSAGVVDIDESGDGQRVLHAGRSRGRCWWVRDTMVARPAALDQQLNRTPCWTFPGAPVARLRGGR